MLVQESVIPAEGIIRLLWLYESHIKTKVHHFECYSKMAEVTIIPVLFCFYQTHTKIHLHVDGRNMWRHLWWFEGIQGQNIWKTLDFLGQLSVPKVGKCRAVETWNLHTM